MRPWLLPGPSFLPGRGQVEAPCPAAWAPEPLLVVVTSDWKGREGQSKPATEQISAEVPLSAAERGGGLGAKRRIHVKSNPFLAISQTKYATRVGSLRGFIA